MPWVGLQCVVVLFPDHTHLLFLYDTSLIEREPKVLIALDDLRDSLTPIYILTDLSKYLAQTLCKEKSKRICLFCRGHVTLSSFSLL